MSRTSAACSPARSIRGLRQGQALQAGGRRNQGRDRLGAPAQGLIEARQHRPAPLPGGKAAGERRARQAVDRADRGQAQAAQQESRLGRDPQGLDRKDLDRRAGGTGGGDAPVLRAEAGERPGGPWGVGDTETGLEAQARQARRDLRRHGRLAAEEMGAARDVQQHSVIAVDRAPRREAVAPERKPLETAAVLLRLAIGDGEAGHEGAGVREMHVGSQTLRLGLPVYRRQHRPMAARRDEREGDRLSRPCALGQGAGPRPCPLPAQLVDRPARQPD